jgi:hypothetical protein
MEEHITEVIDGAGYLLDVLGGFVYCQVCMKPLSRSVQLFGFMTYQYHLNAFHPRWCDHSDTFKSMEPSVERPRRFKI